MSLIQSITEFLESIFKKSSPEVQKKQQLKKMEAEIRSFEPAICRDGKLTGNFAEAIYALYKNTRPLDNLFMATVSPTDIPKQHRFEAQLITTGYDTEYIDILNSLDYETKKNEILFESSNVDRVYMHQRKQLEKLLKQLNTEEFKQMDQDLLGLRHFVDFCHYSFIQFLQVFDSNFIPADFSYKPKYYEVPITKAINLLEDFYYQLAGLKLTSSLVDLVRALKQLTKGDIVSEIEMQGYMSNLKKINYIVSKVLTEDKIRAIIRLTKEESAYEPAVSVYTGSPRQEFANMMQSKFDAEEQRIRSEIQDEQISSEVNRLFKNIPIESVFGYNSDGNNALQENTPMSFKWLLPMRILKTFLKHYVSPGIKNLLNDIVIEGFFSNPAYKSNFSSTVYSVINAEEELKGFETSFESGHENSIAVMQGYINDSHKDKDFYKKLELMVGGANNQAHEILQSVTTALFSLYKEMGELLADSKKPSSEIISNLKVLMMSSRNKDNTNLLEEQYPNWAIYFDIMKNYVIINSPVGEK
ncbi:MAG: DUF5312 family protein [Treponema sp.]|nr:DUF5312 family protein [Treponema sp.]